VFPCFGLSVPVQLTRFWNDLLGVKWDVKPYTLTHSLRVDRRIQGTWAMPRPLNVWRFVLFCNRFQDYCLTPQVVITQKTFRFRGLQPLPSDRSLSLTLLGALSQMVVISSRSELTMWLPKLYRPWIGQCESVTIYISVATSHCRWSSELC